MIVDRLSKNDVKIAMILLREENRTLVVKREMKRTDGAWEGGWRRARGALGGAKKNEVMRTRMRRPSPGETPQESAGPRGSVWLGSRADELPAAGGGMLRAPGPGTAGVSCGRRSGRTVSRDRRPLLTTGAALGDGAALT